MLGYRKVSEKYQKGIRRTRHPSSSNTWEEGEIQNWLLILKSRQDGVKYTIKGSNSIMNNFCKKALLIL